MKRRDLLQSLAAGGLLTAAERAAARNSADNAQKVLRLALSFAETGFDPAQISDSNSNMISGAIFEAPLTYDYLARPGKLKPRLADGMPEVSADFRTYTVRVKRGVFFADDPAFKGQRREVTAADFVYAVKRLIDPRWKSPNFYVLENARLLGAVAARSAALKGGGFDYDADIEGVRALDRYTYQLRLGEPDPRFIYNLLAVQFAPVAREVVAAYANDMMAHPVGTGPFRLADWRRASRVVLERNPGYREVLYDEEAPADDPRSQEIAQRLRGKRMPFVDRVEFYVVEESQPRWLSYLNGDHDYLDGLPPEYAHTIIPNGVMAPNLARRGIQMDRLPLVDVVLSYFNMEHPVVGGYTPEKVALRRAMALAYDQDTEIRQIRKSQMIKANGQIAPLTYGFDPAFRTEASQTSLPRAKALLDAFGWVDRNGDGWRETPDGRPLSIVYSTGSTALDRQYNELWKKNMTQLGIRMEFDVNQWPEHLKASRAGRLMMWGVAWIAGIPDGQAFLELGYSKNKGQANHARFDLPAYDALFERQKRMPDGPERLAMLRDMQRLFVAFTPYKLHGHRIRTDLTHPWVIGYRRHPYLRAFFQFVDIDTDARARALG